MNAAMAIVSATLRQILDRKRLLLLGALTLSPGLIYYLSTDNQPTASSMLGSFLEATIFHFSLTVPITALILSAAALGAERRDQTLSFVVLRPIGRLTIASAKLGSAFLAAVALNAFGALTLSAAYGARSGDWSYTAALAGRLCDSDSRLHRHLRASRLPVGAIDAHRARICLHLGERHRRCHRRARRHVTMAYRILGVRRPRPLRDSASGRRLRARRSHAQCRHRRGSGGGIRRGVGSFAHLDPQQKRPRLSRAGALNPRAPDHRVLGADGRPNYLLSMISGTPASLNRRMGVAAAVVSGGVLLSRLLGQLREMIFAGMLGADAVTDQYVAAFRIPDFLNYLLAGGFLAITFIPIFSRYLANDDEDGGWEALTAIVRPVALGIAILAVVGWALAPAAIELIYPEFTTDQVTATVRLTRIVLPAQVFFVVGALFSAVQYAKGVFTIPTLAPIVYNAGIIIGGVVFALATGEADPEGFIWGALVGAFLGNFALQWWGARRVGMRFSSGTNWRHPALRKYIAIAVPLMVGQSIVVLDETFMSVFGDLAGDGAQTRLQYARRTMFVPVGVIAQAAAVAAYPFLARLFAEGQKRRMADTVDRALRWVLALSIGAAALVAAMSLPIVRLLFERYEFLPADTEDTAGALFFLALAIPVWGGLQVLTRAFYARPGNVDPGHCRKRRNGGSHPAVLVAAARIWHRRCSRCQRSQPRVLHHRPRCDLVPEARTRRSNRTGARHSRSRNRACYRRRVRSVRDVLGDSVDPRRRWHRSFHCPCAWSFGLRWRCHRGNRRYGQPHGDRARTASRGAGRGEPEDHTRTRLSITCGGGRPSVESGTRTGDPRPWILDCYAGGYTPAAFDSSVCQNASDTSPIRSINF